MPAATERKVDDKVSGTSIPRVRVFIRRDSSTEVAVEVREYELPILEMLQGEINVRVDPDTKVPDQVVENLDVNTEWHNLFVRYTGAGSDEAIRATYPAPAVLAKVIGVKAPKPEPTV